jgi:hypothetical protein
VLAAIAEYDAVVEREGRTFAGRVLAMRQALIAAEEVVQRRLAVDRQARAAAAAQGLMLASLTSPPPVAIEALSKGGIVTRCHAQQHGDEMQCGRCGLTWDTNDPEPPTCSPVERRVTVRREVDQ